MIVITPAILTASKEHLEQLLKRYVEAGFSYIDIDIQESGFASESTLSFADALEVVQAADLPAEISLGWDLKVSQPQKIVATLTELAEKVDYKVRTYVYSSAQIDFLSTIKLNHHVGVGILASSGLKGLDFYTQFPEVQLLTIESEQQGAKLKVDLLDRATQLREMGYTGSISLDGGINLKSAELVNAYARELRIDRVSVGSYFQESKNIELDKQKLQLALNIKVLSE